MMQLNLLGEHRVAAFKVDKYIFYSVSLHIEAACSS
jgi:hypothetical protein